MIEAVVQTGSYETVYRRAGSGGPVLLLVGAWDPAGEWLFEHLAARFRTIAPVPPEPVDAGEPGITFEPWLRGLIDGLGLEGPALVATRPDGAALLRFAAADPHRVERVALVTHGATAGAPDPARASAGAGASHPVLLLGIPGPEEPAARADALARLLEFLAAAPARAVTGSRSVS